MQGSTYKLGKHDAGLPQPRGVQVSDIDLTLKFLRTIVFVQCNSSCMRTAVADQARFDHLKHAWHANQCLFSIEAQRQP